jgi:gas vesicle protein
MSRNNQSASEALDDGSLFWGFFVGLLAGSIVALFSAPQSGRVTRRQISSAGQNAREKLEAAVPTDPVADSIAEGKAAARRRRMELGLNN